MDSAAPSVAPPLRRWLRVEGGLVLLLAVVLYENADYPWLWFAVLFLAPDLSLAGYLAGSRVGSWCYNVLHSYAGPVALGVAFLEGGIATLLPLVWAAHIGFDRMLGYGLKYPTAFTDTHLGRVGKQAVDTVNNEAA